MDSRGHNEGSHAKPGATAGQSSHHHHPAPTKAELMSSAKLLGGAAKAKLHHDPNKPNKAADKAELAGAAADLLNAASHYGKLEEKGMGKYVGKAEDYLHKYHTSHSQTATAAGGSAHHSAAAAAEQAHSSGHSGGNNQGDHHSGGYGEYINMAEGIFKKHNESSTTTAGQSHSGNKYGEYAKMAGDFLKKH